MLRALKHRLRHWAQQLRGGNRDKIKNLRTKIRQEAKPVMVLGSAPGTQLPQGWRTDHALITVNAAQVVGTQLGLNDPDIAVITGTLMGELPANVAAKAQLRDKATGTILYIDRLVIWKVGRKLLEQMNYRFDEALVMTHEARNHIMQQVIGENLGMGRDASERVSNGIFAILLAIHLGYPQIVIAGINPGSSGHAYDSNNAPREHSDPDAHALQLIARQHRNVYAAAPELAAKFGLPLWSA